MPIKVQIIEDDEIRAQIRDMVSGQLRGIVRKEVRAIIKEQITGAIEHGLTKENMLALAGAKIKQTYFTTTEFRSQMRAVIADKYIDFIDENIKGFDFEKMALKLVRERIGGITRT